jgi:hypothetical protein
MHIYEKLDVEITDSFIDEFARKYIEQRSKTAFDLTGIDSSIMFNACGFNATMLEGIIKKNSIPHDFSREQGKEPLVLRDIYRSDLGELLMTYYFEEKLDDKSQFVIPLKNITFRERADMPGRGLDAIGYRVENNRINVLLGEAKVSGEKKSPPAVVDVTDDSLYKTHNKHNKNLDIIIARLTDYCKRIGTTDAEMIGLVILSMEVGKKDTYSLTFGCTLIRDFCCVDEASDYGKMKSNADEFHPNNIHFSIISFKEREIKETVDLFYAKVQELIR